MRATCTLTSDWGQDGPQPHVGAWMKTRRGRTAYEIVAVAKVPRRDGERRNRYRLTCMRHPPSEIPAGATLYGFVWYRRERRRR